MKTIITEKLSIFFDSFFYCFRISWQASPKYFLVRSLGKFIIPLNGVILSFLSKGVIDWLQKSYNASSMRPEVLAFLFAIVCIRVVSNTAHGVIDYATQMHSIRLNELVAKKIIHIGCSEKYSVFDDTVEYSKMISVVSDVTALTRVFWNAIDCISPFVVYIIIFTSLCRLDVSVSLLMTMVSIPAAFIHYKYTVKLYKLDKESIKNERQKDYYTRVATSKEFGQDVRFFGLEKTLIDKYDIAQREELSRRKGIIGKETIKISLVAVIPEVAMFAISLYLVKGISYHQFSLGDYTLYTGLLYQMWSNIVGILTNSSKVIENQLKISNYKRYISAKGTIEEDKQQKLQNIESIEFKNVSFRYQRCNINAIDNLSFRINKGEKVAIVGVNGAGKTTIIKLLLGLYQPESGEILVNDRSISEYDIDSLHKAMSICFQNMTLYAFSLLENIALGVDAPDEKKAVNIINDVQAANILTKAKNNLKQHVTRLFESDGLEVSGGEAQRLVLGRAFYREADLLLFDEPSSALDPEAEKQIFEIMKEKSEGRTLLFTSHRLTNISLAERILVIEDGHLVEQGDFSSLMKSNGRFFELYNCYLGRA